MLSVQKTTPTSAAEEDFIEFLADTAGPTAFSAFVFGAGGQFRTGPWIGGQLLPNIATGKWTLENGEGQIANSDGTPIGTSFVDWVGLEPNNPASEFYLGLLDWRDPNLDPGANGPGFGWHDCTNGCYNFRPRSYVVEFPVPEPTAFASFGIGFVVVARAIRRRRRA